ncbi:hypothetical protein RJD38_05970 [Vibrio scophthalmi]|uniref:Uncharacterized protein n=1 Tax=Vibrio scophthalmi TaxID=45658 RepID=A0A1C7FF16_9VIBR|nr:hypothetical protein [Vibrio scophthalmi]ANU37944.1 hypothetical protein VSVS05_02890 [Vibrio scophthalmi]
MKKKIIVVAISIALITGGFAFFPVSGFNAQSNDGKTNESPTHTNKSNLNNSLELKEIVDKKSLQNHSEKGTGPEEYDDSVWEQHLSSNDDLTANQIQPEYWLANSDKDQEETNSNNPKLASESNAKPTINHDIHQQIQATINQWSWAIGAPVRESLNIAGLFEDPENDLLSIRIELQAQGIRLSGYPVLLLSGTPTTQTQSGSLTILARDNAHDSEKDSGWVSAHFHLPISTLPTNNSHPLEGDTFYRLETTYSLAGKQTTYEVVYCEAFKFTNQEVYFAASTNKIDCPEEDKLKPIGQYEISGNQIILASNLSHFDAQQTWTLRKQYDSVQQPDSVNYFVSVDSGKHIESYTMLKNKVMMEKRINNITGQYVFQMAWFDFLLPIDDEEFMITKIGNYIYDYKDQVAGENGETTDSDLNLVGLNTSLSCASVAPWFENGVLAGPGKYDIDIISTTNPTNPQFTLDCFEFVNNDQTKQIALAFDLVYTPYEEFIHGEIYSYILKPKPQYADKIEEIKLNLIYTSPQS